MARQRTKKKLLWILIPAAVVVAAGAALTFWLTREEEPQAYLRDISSYDDITNSVLQVNSPWEWEEQSAPLPRYPSTAPEGYEQLLDSGDLISPCRRILVCASEDIGLADSRALEIALAAYQACHFLGMPECNIHLAHAVIYLSLAPRSNAVYRAYESAKRDALTMLDEPVPLVIRNAPTGLMKDLGYGDGYVYAHDVENKVADMECLPESLRGRRYYHPTESGSESRMARRLEEIRTILGRKP